jgi:hypothetical protein
LHALRAHRVVALSGRQSLASEGERNAAAAAAALPPVVIAEAHIMFDTRALAAALADALPANALAAAHLMRPLPRTLAEVCGARQRGYVVWCHALPSGWV